MKKIMEMTSAELDTRAAEIAAEIETADEKRIAEINSELDEIEARRAQIKAANEARSRAAAAVAKGAGQKIGGGLERTNMEIRNSSEYIKAFANYVKTGKDAECRALLTENVQGTVPVPEFIENKVKQAWENDEIFNRVTKTFVPGNLKVGFELSATDAAEHTEGAAAPAEEQLVLGIVTMVPKNIKKWITVSDEVLALGAQDFLTYIYDELTYKIIHKAADVVISRIQNAPAASTAEAIGVESVTASESSIEDIIDAVAKLGDAAQNNVLIADGTWIASVKKAALQANYAIDPFEGLTVIRRKGMTGAIVGDLSGVQANMPEGENIIFKFDDLSLAEKDLVKIVGRLYAAIEITGPEMLVNITGE